MPTKTRSAARTSHGRGSQSSAAANHPPAWIKPEVAGLVKSAPDGPDWLHEIKLDGYRMHARLDAGRVQILTRRGNDWTAKYTAITEAISGLPAKNAYLDGELCGVLPDGKTAFNLIQNASDTGQGALVFFLFDLLFLDGENITGLPLLDRKARLANLLTGAVKPSQPALPASIDIRIAVPGRIFVRGHGLDSEWRGQIAVT